MEKTGNKTVKILGIAAALILVGAIVVVNIIGTGDKGIVTKAFSEAFAEEKAVTDASLNDYAEEAALSKLLSQNNREEADIEVMGVGNTGNSIMNAILKMASLNVDSKRDIENGLSENYAEAKFNGNTMFSSDVYTSEKGITFTIPEIEKDTYLISGDTQNEMASIAEKLRFLYSGEIAEMGNKAADYFITLLKFGEYERLENGSIIVSISENKLDAALSFAKTFLGEKLEGDERFPIDINTLALNNVKAEVVLNEDESLKEAVLGCNITYSLKGDSENIKEAAFGAGIKRDGSLNVLTSVTFPENKTFGLNIVRKTSDGKYDVSTSLFRINDPENTTLTINKILYPEGDKTRDICIKVISGENGNTEEIGLNRSDKITLGEDGTVNIDTHDAEIYKLTGIDEGSVIKFDIHSKISPYEEEISVPEGIDMTTLTEKDIKELKADIIKKITLNSLSAFIGK